MPKVSQRRAPIEKIFARRGNPNDVTVYADCLSRCSTAQRKTWQVPLCVLGTCEKYSGQQLTSSYDQFVLRPKILNSIMFDLPNPTRPTRSDRPTRLARPFIPDSSDSVRPGPARPRPTRPGLQFQEGLSTNHVTCKHVKQSTTYLGTNSVGRTCNV